MLSSAKQKKFLIPFLICKIPGQSLQTINKSSLNELLKHNSTTPNIDILQDPGGFAEM